MKLGINDGVNKSTKKAALQLMDGGKLKINPPNSHPSNAIHKAALTKKEPGAVTQTAAGALPRTPGDVGVSPTSEPTPTAGCGSEAQDVNKIAVAVGAVAVAGLAFLSFR